MSSPESMAHRDQDFDYEVIEAGGPDQFGFMQTQVPVADTPMSSNFEDAEENSISVADHYRGTPPLRSKKKGGRNSSRFSQEIPSEFQVIFLIIEMIYFMLTNYPHNFNRFT